MDKNSEYNEARKMLDDAVKTISQENRRRKKVVESYRASIEAQGNQMKDKLLKGSSKKYRKYDSIVCEFLSVEEDFICLCNHCDIVKNILTDFHGLEHLTKEEIAGKYNLSISYVNRLYLEGLKRVFNSFQRIIDRI